MLVSPTDYMMHCCFKGHVHFHVLIGLVVAPNARYAAAVNGDGCLIGNLGDAGILKNGLFGFGN